MTGLPGEQGRAVLDAVLPGAGAAIEAAYAPLAPEMAEWILGFAFGTVAARDDLSMRERVVSNLSALTALGGTEAQLAVQVAMASALGMTRREIVGVFLNTAPVVGLARAQNALRAVAGALPTTTAEDPA